MKIVVAPQALKGSLDATEVAEAMTKGIRAVLPHADVVALPLADGGEGTVRALVAASSGELRAVRVTGPLGEPVEAEFGLLGPMAGQAGRTAIIEMAAASGLPLVPVERRDPLCTTTYGTGELMGAAMDAGCDRLLIGIGGSATNDGGAGMAQALGVSFLDAEGRELVRGGAALSRLDHIVLDNLDPRLRRMRVEVACDVSNPLCGPAGASAVYGPQKGATPAMVDQLDVALAHYARMIQRDVGLDVADTPGAGAAGGLGAGLLAFANAKLTPGAELVLDALQFSRHAQGATLVLTAEGQLDGQTAYGKTISAVARLGKALGIPVVALAGRVAMTSDDLDRLGIAAAAPLADGPMSLQESMARADELVVGATVRVLRLMRVGQGFSTGLS